jgi:hypothetical protein
LLSAYPLNGSPPKENLDHACHLAILALMTTMMIRGSPKHCQYYHLLRKGLLAAIDKVGDQYAEFKFWAYYVGGASVFDHDEDKKWLSLRIRSMASKLGITTATEARSTLLKYPWVRYFHDQYCETDFWNLQADFDPREKTAAINATWHAFYIQDDKKWAP